MVLPFNIYNSKFTDDSAPIDEACSCPTCSKYSRAFLRHLFIIEDALAGRLCTLHNVYYFLDLMKKVRTAIAAGSFFEFAREFIAREDQIFLGGEKEATRYPDRFV